MKNKYSYISDISFINSLFSSINELKKLYSDNILCDKNIWSKLEYKSSIEGLKETINSRLRNRMSALSLGIFNALAKGPGENLKDYEEIILFSGFGEIETTNIIIKNILVDRYAHVSPTLFHNSVHHTPLGYYSIIKKLHNPCITISDGLKTNLSFINYLKYRVLLPESLIAAFGDEASGFYELDKTVNKKIYPVYGAYRITPNSSTGFRYCGYCDNIDEINRKDEYKDAEIIYACKNTFLKLKKITDKKIITEYPLVLDAPVGIILRLALPFIFGKNKKSIVLEEIDNKIHYFEVRL